MELKVRCSMLFRTCCKIYEETHKEGHMSEKPEAGPTAEALEELPLAEHLQPAALLPLKGASAAGANWGMAGQVKKPSLVAWMIL